MSQKPRSILTQKFGQEQRSERLDAVKMHSIITVRSFSKPGLAEKLVAAKRAVDLNKQVNEEILKKHYASLDARSFSNRPLRYRDSSPVAPLMVGLGVVKTGCQMLGKTDAAKPLPSSISDNVCIQVGNNITRGSDAVESDQQEINTRFNPQDQIKWRSVEDPWLHE